MKTPENQEDQKNFLMWAHEVFILYLAPILNAGRPIEIGTHDGRFHADEVVAIAILILFIATNGGRWKIHRLDRDGRKTLDAMDILVDVGGEFDPSRGRFDHHQAGGAGRRYMRHGADLPFSSCGLVWWSCGLLLLDECTEAFEEVDWRFIRGIDASDNGAIMPNGFQVHNDHGRLIHVPGSPSHISEEIGKANNLPANDPVKGQLYDPEAPMADQRYAKFMIALMDRAYSSLICTLEQAKATPQARQAIENGLESMRDGILILPKVRWMEELFKVDGHRQVRIVIREANEGYELKCLHGLKAPVEWRGKNNGDLLIKDLKFCHHGGQIIGAETKEAALEAARKILEHNYSTAA